MAVVSITLAVVALVARAEAERQRAEAVRQRDTATSAALASQAENRLATEPDLAALLALEAYRTKDTVDALGSLHLPGHDAPVVVVAVSPDGTMVVSADDAGTVQLQEIGGAQALEVKTPEAFLPLAFAFAFPSPEVLWVGGAVDPAEGDTESLALRIDTSTGEVVERVVHNGESGHFVESIALSPDGTRLATGGSDRRIQLWDTADLAAGSAELAGHLDSVADIVFVSDDVMFAGDREGRILMWDLVDARSVGELTGPSDGVASLALDPDGTSLVAGSEDDIVWSWDLEIESWLAGACNLAGRNMTEAEWTRFQLGGEPVRQCPQFGPDQWPAAIYPIEAP